MIIPKINKKIVFIIIQRVSLKEITNLQIAVLVLNPILVTLIKSPLLKSATFRTSYKHTQNHSSTDRRKNLGYSFWNFFLIFD